MRSGIRSNRSIVTEEFSVWVFFFENQLYGDLMGQPGIIMWFFHLGSDGATAFQHHPIIETSFSALSALLRTKRIWLIHLVDLLAQKSHLRSKKESSCLLCFTSLCHSAGLDSLPCYESAGMKRNTAAYDEAVQHMHTKLEQ